MGQVKSRKLEYFGHVSRHNSLEKDIMLGFMPGTKRQGGQKRQWIDNVTQWTGKGLMDIVRLAENRELYRCLILHYIWHRLHSFTGHGTIAMVQAKGDAAVVHQFAGYGGRRREGRGRRLTVGEAKCTH